MGPLQPARVLTNRPVRVGTWLMRLESTGPHVPGQCIGVCLDPATPPRSYSLCSPSRDTAHEILYDVVDGGALTPALARLGPGDVVLCTRPFGAFRDHPGPSVWVATGTGVAPFVSMARTDPCADKTLVQGSGAPDGLHFRSLFQTAGLRSYVPCCSRRPDPTVYAGRVTAYLAACDLDPVAHYLLCGSAQMIVDARDLLIARGVPYRRILAEVYF